MGHRLAICAATAAAFVAIAPPAGAGSSEPELKAQFVERFTRFVDWDDGDLPSEFQVCVVGDSPVEPYLRRIVGKKKKLKGRPAVVVELSSLADVVDCQVVVIPSVSKKKLANVLRRTEGLPILTVADQSGAAAAGAIINFYRDGNHVKFEINTAAARDSNLSIRAKLLRLARLVRSGKEDG
jgi:hypothetical protein